MSSYTVTSSWVNVILCIYGLVSHKCPTHDGRQQKGMGESGLADGLFQFDKTIVFHFYDFVLVLSAVSSRCQLYSVGPSEGKLIPNSVFFIQSFREFRA